MPAIVNRNIKHYCISDMICEFFVSDLSDVTLELLFELYDEPTNAFLGLGIVGIEELMATPSQRQIIPLQARPYENDTVSGSLTVEVRLWHFPCRCCPMRMTQCLAHSRTHG